MAGKKKREKKHAILPWAAALAIILFPTVAVTILNPPGETADRGIPVIGIIDGDTIVLEGKTRVRLRHADAPETDYCGGKEAKNALERLTRGKRVRLEELIPDQRGRGMALIYAGETLINREMIAQGWARYHHDISSKTDELKAARDDAKVHGRGIYGRCQSTENRTDPNCTIKGNIDPQSGEKRYYLPGCAQYPYTIVERDIGEAWFCTETAAQEAGYRKARTCAEE